MRGLVGPYGLLIQAIPAPAAFHCEAFWGQYPSCQLASQTSAVTLYRCAAAIDT